MKQKHLNSATAKQNTNNASVRNRPRFSKVTMKIARDNLKKYEAEADESFLTRIEIEKRLSDL